MVSVGVALFAGFVKYTVVIHQAWAEGEGEALGLDWESRGFGTILRGPYRGVPLMLALSGRRVTEGEARRVHGLATPTEQEFLAAKALFGSTHFKADAVWAEFPRSTPGEPPERYADALVTVAAFAAAHSLDEIFELEHGEEE